MSLENLTPGEAEPLIDARKPMPKVQKQQLGTGNSSGVDVGGTPGSETKISRETSGAEAQASANGGVGVRSSSVDPSQSKSDGEQRANTWSHALGRSKGRGDGPRQPGIETPDKVRKLQTVLYRKAKKEPSYRFYSLYGDVCRQEVLALAWTRIRANGGAGGVDGIRPADIRLEDRESWLADLREELVGKTYREWGQSRMARS